MNIFRTIILGVFLFFLVFAVLVFSGVINFGEGGGNGIGGEVVLWGTFPEADLRVALREFDLEHGDDFLLTYVQKNRASLDRDLTEALASGVGPDLVLLPDDLLVRHFDKILPIPYDSYSERQFKDTFVEEGELFLNRAGVLGLPFSVNPMVLYWNRDILNAVGVTEPPKYWDDLFSLIPTITEKNQNFTITKATIALGEYQNIVHAKDILALLMLQAGEPIVTVGEAGLQSVLGQKHGFVDAPAVSALRFYTEFSNSAKEFYTWNRALPNDKDYFARGDLAFYLGYASEYEDIEAQNPSLNFDIAQVPQVRGSERLTTVGDMTSFVLMRSSKNPRTASYASFLLVSPQFVQSVMSEVSGYSAARRDLLGAGGRDATEDVVRRSSLISRSWLDPNPTETEKVFQEMIESVVSGRSRLSESLERAGEVLTTLLRR